jgi:tetratricopeptide (TPR) repeat protein
MLTLTRLAATALIAGALLLPSALGAQGAHAEGVKLFEGRQYAAARSYFERALSANARDAEAAMYLGRLAMIDNKDDQAAKLFERAIAAAPDNSDYHMWLGRAYGRQAQRAGALSKIGLAKKTRAAMEKAVTLDGNNVEAREDLMQYYAQAPGIVGGSMEKAAQQAEEIRKRDAVRGATSMAFLYERQKKWADAERIYLTLLREHPEVPNGALQVGMFYQRAEQYEKAFEHFEGMLRKDANDLAALYQVGRTGAMSGRHLDRATEALQRYLEAGPDSTNTRPPPAAAHFRLGNIYEKSGDRARAKAEYEMTLKLQPDHREAKGALKRVR